MKKLLKLFLIFAKVGVLTFGGGLAMLPMLKRELVDKNGYVTEEQLIDYYAVGQCTPGIIAVNTATFVGYNEAGISGAVAATAGIVAPSLVIILIIAALLQGVFGYAIVQNALAGIRAAVCALLVHTVISLARKSLVDGYTVVLFVLALALCFWKAVPTVLIIIVCGLLGIVIKKVNKEA